MNPEVPSSDTAVTPASTTLLNRVVFPEEYTSPEVLPVYLRVAGTSGISDADGYEVTGRRSVAIEKGTTVSFDSFFNSFPAAHWRRWTKIQNVILRLKVTGKVRLDIYRTAGNGRVTHDSSRTINSTEEQAILLPIAKRFSDGGFYWFNLKALEDVELVHAEWHAEEPFELRNATIGICTFNRANDCVNTLKRLVADELVASRIRRVVIADQGTQAVEDHPEFAEVAAAWGGKVEICRQPNLGGSGGFSRTMYETLQDPFGGDVIVTDDDISPEPESFHRSIAFASATNGRVLVHGHMLDLWSQSRLHNTGDLVDRDTFVTRAVHHGLQDLDLAKINVSTEPALSSRREADFGGWWMCLIPREVLNTIGLSMPVFIKWDDVEYGLRAQRAGFPTVTLPGVAVWHQPFYLKDVQTDWTAYFEVRNRLITAIVHGKMGEARHTIRNNLKVTGKNILTMNYSAIILNNMAIRDLLEGPESVRDGLPDIMRRVAAARGACSDAKVTPDVPEEFETTVTPSYVEKLVREPATRVESVTNVVKAFAASARSVVRPRATPRSADLSGVRPNWQILARMDRAAVATADGSGVTLRERDLDESKALAVESARLHQELLHRLPEIRVEYRRKFQEWVSPQSWAGFFK